MDLTRLTCRPFSVGIRRPLAAPWFETALAFTLAEPVELPIELNGAAIADTPRTKPPHHAAQYPPTNGDVTLLPGQQQFDG